MPLGIDSLCSKPFSARRGCCSDMEETVGAAANLACVRDGTSMETLFLAQPALRAAFCGFTLATFAKGMHLSPTGWVVVDGKAS